MTMNECSKCVNHARVEAIEGMSEVMVDDGDARDMDDAEMRILTDADRLIALGEQISEMLMNTDCEEWH